VAIRSRALTLVPLGILPPHGAQPALTASLPSRKAPTQSTALPERHPATLLMANFEATSSRLITLVGGLVRDPPPSRIPSWWCSCTGPKRSCCRPWQGIWANGNGRSVGAEGCPSHPKASFSCRAAGSS